jgi:PAS domain S-box-containing protein
MDLALEQYRVLVEAAPTMIWRAGLDGRCDYFNETWLQFTGRPLQLELGDGWAGHVHPDDVQRCLQIYEKHFAARRAFEMEYRLRRHDGVYRWVFDRGTPFHDEHGAFAGFIGHCIDVDERRRANEAKAAFLTMLMHELRTPLQTLVLHAREARKASENGSVMSRADIDRLDRQIARLRRLVLNASDGVRAGEGAPLAIERTAVDLVALARASVETWARTTKRHVTLRLHTEGEPRSWSADAERITRALDILIDNAIKYSPEGGTVDVSVSFEPASARLVVTDEGPGVPAEEISRLGEPFFRGSNARLQSHPGLGLGLAIARAIASAHGGKLDIANHGQHGIAATFVLPEKRDE